MIYFIRYCSLFLFFIFSTLSLALEFRDLNYIPNHVDSAKEVLFLNNEYSDFISRYLDSDKRPNALITTPSSAQFWVFDMLAADVKSESLRARKPKLFFWGLLGAIESSTAGRYVGFTGVEIKESAIHFLCPSNPAKEPQLEFDISVQSPGANTLTVEFVVNTGDEILTYTKDFSVVQGPNQFRLISLLEFERTVRGVSTGEFYNSQGELQAYRFFFKRSVNQAQSTKAIPIKFTLNLPKTFI